MLTFFICHYKNDRMAHGDRIERFIHKRPHSVDVEQGTKLLPPFSCSIYPYSLVYDCINKDFPKT